MKGAFYNCKIRRKQKNRRKGSAALEDNDIIELYFARNEAAIAETEKKYSGYCGAVARNILNKREDEEECLNDTWLSVWNDIPPSRPSVFRAYLGRITRNLSLNILRRRGAGKRGGLEVIFGELDEALPAVDSVERELDGRELAAAVNEFIAGLSPQERFFFLRRYWYCDPVAEIARRSGVQPQKISQVLFRLRARLKKKLEEEGHI